MAKVWLAWERRKRQHDSHMDDARALLRALPSHTPLPQEFLSHLNALLVVPPSCMGPTQQPAAISLPVFSQFPPLHGPSAAATSSLVQNVDAGFMTAHAPHGHLLQNHPGSFAHASRGIQSSTAPRVAIHGPMHMQPEYQPPLDPAEGAGVRLLGQHAASTEAVGRALHGLQAVQEREVEVFLDMLSSQLPGVLLHGEQLMRLWADHFVSQVVPPDFIELCQIAATQQNRRALFKQPLS